MSAPVVLVTGVAGQDGSYLAEQLLAQGCEVHGLVRPGGRRIDLPGLHTHEGDVSEPGLWGPLLDAISPAEIYHLAGATSVGRSWAEPVATAASTGMSAMGLLAAVDAGAGAGRGSRVLLASSAEIFAGATSSPQDESTPVRPVSPYGAAKAFAHVAGDVYRRRGIHVVNAVLYNHESPRRPETFVTQKIVSTVARIAAGEGDELVLGNVEARRDWGWAPEYVAGMVLACRHDEPTDVVLATGRSHSVREFALAAFTAAGVPDGAERIRIDPALVRPADGADLRGDPSLAGRVLGWRARVGFEELVTRLVAAAREPSPRPDRYVSAAAVTGFVADTSPRARPDD